MKYNVLTPSGVERIYPELTDVYISAFAGPPWYEVSRCPDMRLRCEGGLSRLAIGATCDTCLLKPNEPAYTQDGLEQNWRELTKDRSVYWWVESNELGITMAALAWKATAGVIADEKYPDQPEMKTWLKSRLGEGEIVWLDEVFADRTKKPSGNLKAFGQMCESFAEELLENTLAYRTISSQMISAARRDFDTTEVFTSFDDVPDRRSFVIVGVES